MDERWRVLRQDDNGNRYVVVVVTSVEEAERIVATFEARGHEQMYWVERVSREDDG
ncbi:MAG: SPOR domain-containing protein [Sandaracinaceae bacterium]